MSERAYRTIDKAEWGEGPWQNEPDKVVWIDKTTGLDCMIVRHPYFGNFCGYVGVGPDHSLYGRDYDEPLTYDLDVHGGLTFAAPCRPDEDESTGICHTAEPGRPDHVFWFGFDCHHCWDFAPGFAIREKLLEDMAGFPKMPDHFIMRTTYKDINYVRAEVRRLAEQVYAKGPLPPVPAKRNASRARYGR